MVRAVAPASEEAEHETGDKRNRLIEVVAEVRELEWWRTMWKVNEQIENPELKKKFSEAVWSRSEDKYRLMCSLLENQQCDDEYRQNRREYKKQTAYLKQKIVNLRQRPTEVEYQQDDLQQQSCERSETLATIPAKRQWDAAFRNGSDDEYNGDNNGPPCRERTKFNPPGFSREQIRFVLGCSDRDWGASQCRTRSRYEYVVVLGIDAHLLGRRPSHGQNISEAVFGFGLAENEVISGGIEFPLFVRNSEETRAYQYVYKGNYTATKLRPIEWRRLSESGKDGAVRAVQDTNEPDHHKRDREVDDAYIRHEFDVGVYEVPCCRLEFQCFDDHLKATLDGTPRRVRGLCSIS